MLDQPFVVARMTAGVHDPGQRPLEDPTAGKDHEPGRAFRTLDGPERQREPLLGPVDQLARIGGVPQQMVISGSISRSRNRTCCAASTAVACPRSRH